MSNEWVVYVVIIVQTRDVEIYAPKRKRSIWFRVPVYIGIAASSSLSYTFDCH